MRPQRGFITRKPTPASTWQTAAPGAAKVLAFSSSPTGIPNPRSQRHAGIAPDTSAADLYSTAGPAWGLVASTVWYGLPNTNTFEVRQMIHSNSTNVRIFSRYFHNTRC